MSTIMASMSTSMTLMTTLPKHLMLTTLCLFFAAYNGLAACPDTSLTIVKYDQHVCRLWIMETLQPIWGVGRGEGGRQRGGFVCPLFFPFPIRIQHFHFKIQKQKYSNFRLGVFWLGPQPPNTPNAGWMRVRWFQGGNTFWRTCFLESKLTLSTMSHMKVHFSSNANVSLAAEISLKGRHYFPVFFESKHF